MSFLNFKKDIYHLFFNGDLVILDLIEDQFFFFDKGQSSLIKAVLVGEFVEHDEFLHSFTDKFLQKSQVKQKIINYDSIEGVDNYSWDVTRFYLPENINIKNRDKIFLILIYPVAFLVQRKNCIKYLNFIKNRFFTQEYIPNNIAYINDSAAYIHRISKYFPFRLKCLEFSLILGFFLLYKGSNFNLNIGIQKYDFLSHAWIDINGEIIADRNDLEHKLATILKI